MIKPIKYLIAYAYVTWWFIEDTYYKAKKWILKIDQKAEDYANWRFPVALNPSSKNSREYLKQAYIAGALGKYKPAHYQRKRDKI